MRNYNIPNPIVLTSIGQQLSVEIQFTFSWCFGEHLCDCVLLFYGVQTFAISEIPTERIISRKKSIIIITLFLSEEKKTIYTFLCQASHLFDHAMLPYYFQYACFSYVKCMKCFKWCVPLKPLRKVMISKLYIKVFDTLCRCAQLSCL